MGDDMIERLAATDGHAPEPWWVSDGGNVWSGDISDDEDKIIVRPTRDDAETEATLALIALAPEMKARILSDATTIERLTAALAASQARVVEMTEALRSVREPIEQHRDELLRDFTTAGSMDRSTMDEDEAEWVAEWDAALATIDAALAPAAQADAGTDEGEGR